MHILPVQDLYTFATNENNSYDLVCQDDAACRKHKGSVLAKHKLSE